MLNTPELFFPARGVNGWLIVHELHYNVAFNWNRTWNEYKVGFGTPGTNYWFGLEKLHTLTALHPYRVRIEAHRIPHNVTVWMEMNVFAVASESQYYQLTWSGMSGSVALTSSSLYSGDPITWHNGMVFATYDNNHNTYSPNNCPIVQGGGWWFNDGYFVCLTCVSNPGSCLLASSTSGYNIAGGEVCADQSIMMIRPA
jgi:Fibrinogen beta and gamma chains, C-terminal globular domain